MSAALLIARCLLALVFAVAAVAKLADRAGFRHTLGEFGVPRTLVTPAAIGVPLAELAVAVLLIGEPTAIAGAIGALVLLAAFSAAIARVLRRGEQPDCNCMGQVHSTPVGAGTLARNGALAVVAGTIALAGPGDSFGEAFAGVDVSPLEVALLALVLFQGWISWQLFRQHGRLLERLRRLEATLLPAPPPPGPGDGALPITRRASRAAEDAGEPDARVPAGIG